MPVKNRELKQVVPRHNENRRGPPLNLRVPVRLERNAAAGRRLGIRRRACRAGDGLLGSGTMKPLTNTKPLPAPSARPALNRPPTAEERRRAQRVLLRIAVVIHVDRKPPI